MYHREKKKRRAQDCGEVLQEMLYGCYSGMIETYATKSYGEPGSISSATNQTCYVFFFKMMLCGNFFFPSPACEIPG